MSADISPGLYASLQLQAERMFGRVDSDFAPTQADFFEALRTLALPANYSNALLLIESYGNIERFRRTLRIQKSLTHTTIAEGYEGLYDGGDVEAGSKVMIRSGKTQPVKGVSWMDTPDKYNSGEDVVHARQVLKEIRFFAAIRALNIPITEEIK